jgi:hypothetical protein
MLNQASDWVFVKKPSRPPLSNKEVHYWKQTLKKLLKVGIEVELNLEENKGDCDKQNYMCQCTAVFEAKKPIPGTLKCYEQCSRWDNGNCEIAKEHGCVGINCVAFKQPCSSCSKYDRGCSTCPERYDKLKDPRHIREQVEKLLKPTNFVGQCGESGVYKVVRDGSLDGDGGIEIATVGRRVEFGSLYEMISNIMNMCEERGAFVNERCSIHIHLLASYLTPGFSSDGKPADDAGSKFIKNEVTELERPMPEIIIANFHQLIRRYHCALVWLSSAGVSNDQFTRWEKFRKSILPYSAVRHRMGTVTANVGTASKSKRKYAMMNYEQMKFNKAGDVSRLHVEGRYMDGNLSPAVVVSHACLLYGLMLKAVEISKYGVLQSGNKDYMDLQNEMYNNLCNSDGPWDGSRFSDTKSLQPYIADLKKQSRQLVRLVKSTLGEHSPADEVLSKLAEKPLTYHLMEKKSWKDIEESLLPEYQHVNTMEGSILQLVELGAICECENSDEWIETAAHELLAEHAGQPEELNVGRESLQAYVSQLTARRRIHWSKKLGGFVSST